MTFEEFWIEYDYKVGRIKAEKAWKKLTGEEKRQIFHHVIEYVENTYKDGRYPSRKHPTTYLNNKSWNDEIVTKKDNPRTGGLSTGVEQKIRDFLGGGVPRSGTNPLGRSIEPKEVSRPVRDEDAELTSDLYREVALFYNQSNSRKPG